MDELRQGEDTCERLWSWSVGASSGYSDSAEKVPDFVILPNTNLVEINDDQITPIAPRRGRPRRPANVKKSPFVPGSGLGELSESPLKSVKSTRHANATEQAIEAYLFPLFLNTINFYTGRNDIVLQNDLPREHLLSDPLDVNIVATLPKQSNIYEVLLWHYGRQKQENGERSDFENPGRWRKQARGKKRKKKT
ncbi:hypothetical protein RND71_031912 [Anisodus tanguticus]|uniref:Uncharacterized protein n=1 Tax=Anisodus tanguticus TaxID=243964 RepID=A0AAE1REE7_9SOLA|nr:hypothetical protein RND71_031912 [Anisodus tanguticus]